MTLSNFINELKHNSMSICVKIINLNTSQTDEYVGTVGEFKTSVFKNDYYNEEVYEIQFDRINKNDKKETMYIFCLQ